MTPSHRDPRARPRRRPSRARPPSRLHEPAGEEVVRLYGLHTVAAALANPARRALRLVATRNAMHRLAEAGAVIPPDLPAQIADPRELDRLLGAEAVHQGVMLETEPLAPLQIADLAQARLVLVLDQITDPHNVGAILRSAAAFAADAVIVGRRHSPRESGVLAKAASGALDAVALIAVANVGRALEELKARGLTCIGLDSEGTVNLEDALSGGRIALVLGSEGKGLRQKTRESCDVVARLSVPGAIHSLNVSNAAALALYVADRAMRRPT